MANTTDFTNFATEYPNYFPGQYLLEEDFELQHKYLRDRQRYRNQTLHISGIIEGLEVEVTQSQEAVVIRSGSAIDSQGNLIVLKEDINFADFNDLASGELYLKYQEEKQNQQQNDVNESYTRRVEKPVVEFAEQTPENSVKLVKVIISEDNITLDPNPRDYSGISLPNSNSKTLSLRSGGNANPNLAVLTGSLEIDGDLTVEENQDIKGNLTVSGDISGKINAASINSGVLAVERIPNLSANKITAGNINGNLSVEGSLTSEQLTIKGTGISTFAGNLTVSGAITPSAGNSQNNGIMFPQNAFGGGGDAAWIRYYRRSGEETTFEIGTSNDKTDHIALMPGQGGVGIGTINPTAKLEVKGGNTKLQQENWKTPSMVNGWVNYGNGYNTAGYFKDSLGIVHLKGLVKNGNTNSVIFTLPSGYRPSNRELHVVQTHSSAEGRIDIAANGQVQMRAGNTEWISLDGITFRAA